VSDATYIIAEAGVNHNGSLQVAQDMVRAAVEAGANAIKFQAFCAERLVQRTAPKAAYQAKTTSATESQYDMLRKLELDMASHQVLKEQCVRLGIDFLSTPFDELSLEGLVNLGVQRLKISSGDLTNGPLLVRASRSGLPILLSTGMAYLGEIEDALGALAYGYLGAMEEPSRKTFRKCYGSCEGRVLLQQKVTLLHCTSEYPAGLRDVHLKAMNTLQAAFGLEVGYSDHTEGIIVAVAAVARGARVIEKHFTLDRSLPGPDHQASLEPGELTEMVRAIRVVERALGSPIKAASPSEQKNLPIVRKSLAALAPIRSGEVFTAVNLGCKRPGTGLSPMEYWDMLGRPSSRAYAPDEEIQL